MIAVPILVPLACIVLSSGMAAAIVARDPGLRIHRLIAALLAATTWWSMCELLWQLEDDPEVVLDWVRLSALGWMPLGALGLHIFAEIAGRPRFLMARALPVAYGAAVLGIAIYWSTPDIVRIVETARWGWGYRLDWFFFLPYSIVVTPLCAVSLLWQQVHPIEGAMGGERLVSRAMRASVIVGLAVSFVTEVALPFLGVAWLHLGTAIITLVAVFCAVQLNRFGFSMLSPAAFSREILATLADGIALLYLDGRVRFANRSLEELAGVGPRELHGVEIAALMPGVDRALEPGAAAVELELVRRCGDSVPVVVYAVSLGSEAGTSLVVRDLREIWSLRDRVVTAGRLATVGELSGAIGREILGPAEHVTERLQGLRGEWVEACRGAASEKPPGLSEAIADGEDLIDECLEGVERIVGIAREISRFEGDSSREREPADLNAIVEGALRIAAPAWPEGVQLERRLATLPAVPCVASEIGQVILNLVLNAIDAVERRGRITITSGCTASEAWVEVADDGPGVPVSVRDRIFDPFFTTKPVGKGTGLGLPISFHILERHGGELRCLADATSGARFQVRLPLD